MPKMKTNRSAAKRIKRTGSGKFKRRPSMHGHILTKKSPKRKRRLGHSTLIAQVDEKKMEVLLPN
jgi:large subunit ribosomal protein L35